MFVLVHGKNSFLSYRYAQKVFLDVQTKFPDFQKIILDADSMEPEDIVREYQTGDMFSSGKNIFIKRLYGNKSRADLTENIMNFLNVIDSSTNIVLWEDQKIPANTRYLKYFKTSKTDYEAQELNKRSFFEWGKTESNAYEMKLDNQMIYTLAEDANYDPERYINLLEKLKLKGKVDISSEDIKDVSVNTFEYDIWQLIDAINGKPGEDRVVILEQLLSQRVEPLFIMAMLVRNTRMLIQIKHLTAQGADVRKISSVLRIAPFTVPALIKSAQGTTEQRLELIYRKLYNLDFDIKTGKIDAALGLTLLSTIM